jgi:hypothetical protein
MCSPTWDVILDPPASTSGGGFGHHPLTYEDIELVVGRGVRQRFSEHAESPRGIPRRNRPEDAGRAVELEQRRQHFVIDDPALS